MYNFLNQINKAPSAHMLWHAHALYWLQAPNDQFHLCDRKKNSVIPLDIKIGLPYTHLQREMWNRPGGKENADAFSETETGPSLGQHPRL